VTKKEEEIAEENAEKQKREEALQKLIDKQLKEDEESEIEGFSIEDKANPMEPILK
jgi:cell division protein FtsW